MALISSLDPPTRRIFVYGLLLRLAAVVLLVPTIHEQWFVAFLVDTLASPSFDPWTIYLDDGGDPLAFPYGPVMYLVFVPLTGAGALLDRALDSGVAFAGIGFRLTLLAADLVLLFLLHKLSRNDRRLVPLYWLSPISILVTYWHGQLDIVPVGLVVAALFFVHMGRPESGGFAVALSIVAKLSALLVAPFIAIFLFRNNRFSSLRRKFIVAFLLGTAIILPFLLSPGFRRMILGSPLYNRMFDISLPLSGDLSIFVFPIVYLVLIDFAWQLGRMTQDLLFAFLATALLSIVLLSNAPPGWYLWAVPFLALCGANSNWRTRLIIWLFSIIFGIVQLPLISGATLALSIPDFGFTVDGPLALLGIDPAFYASIGKTMMIACGLSIALRIMRHTLWQDKFYQLSHRPLAIGIAGDSGVGKSTLAEALVDLFGAGAVAEISGDDYHRYDRKGPLWQHLTHLDPRANDLNSMSDDAFSLLSGRLVQCRHYDHATGRFTPRRRIKPKDIVLVDSLHALVPPLLRERLDLKILVEMDEEMRRHLKVTRDMVDRGHTSGAVFQAMERRQPDYEKFVKPQAAFADIIFRLMPATENWREQLQKPGRNTFRLEATLRRAINYEHLTRALIVYGGLRVDIRPAGDYGFNVLTIDADELSTEDTAYIARKIAPEMDELLALHPAWRAGAGGVMQLIVLLELAQLRVARGRSPKEDRR